MNLALTIDLYCTGTSEGAKKAWDSRGRGSDRPTPIKVKSVEEAIPLIRAGKVVELPDTKSVHTLLEKLAKLNERGQHYDLCNVTVKGTNLFCADNIGIARIDMPQFSGYPKPGSLADKLPKDDKGGVNGGEEFIKHLKNIGIATAAESVPAAFLRSSQRELIGTKVADMMEKKGRSLLSKKPIQTADDVRGLRLRVPEIPTWVEMAKALGANPTPIPAGEIYTALQTGVVDAFESPADYILSSRNYEVAGFVTRTHHIFTEVSMMASARKMASLPPDVQKVIRDAAVEAVQKDMWEANLKAQQSAWKIT